MPNVEYLFGIWMVLFNVNRCTSIARKEFSRTYIIRIGSFLRYGIDPFLVYLEFEFKKEKKKHFSHSLFSIFFHQLLSFPLLLFFLWFAITCQLPFSSDWMPPKIDYRMEYIYCCCVHIQRKKSIRILKINGKYPNYHFSSQNAWK